MREVFGEEEMLTLTATFGWPVRDYKFKIKPEYELDNMIYNTIKRLEKKRREDTLNA